MAQMLSKYISYEEATHSNHDIPNQPNSLQLENLQYLCVNVLDKIREHFNSPIFINSMFRSVKLNVEVGGERTSQHLCNGDSAAVDIKKCGNSLMEVYKYVKDNLEFDEMILESVDNIDNPTSMGWLHISIKKKGKLRKKILIMKNKKYYAFN